MAKGQKRHFIVARDRVEVMKEINQNPLLVDIFEQWNHEQQEEFLKICTGVKGIKLLYDAFFKEIINPDTTPERLEELLSLILQVKVKILKVLPHESSRIAAEDTLLVLDIVVELEDGSIANVEVQKIGYAFPGERCACYSSDLLLRQYKRVKGKKGKNFSYKDIKKVYTIIFFEKSPKAFRKFKNTYTYIHRFKQQSDTGARLDLLQEYVFINLDILKAKLDNNSVTIENDLEAWLTFLSIDEPDKIQVFTEQFPEFVSLYEEVYDMCQNMERFMELFSKELFELDKNTVQYMMDEMQDELDEMTKRLSETKEELTGAQEELTNTQEELTNTQEELTNTKDELINTKDELSKEREKLAKMNEENERLQAQLKALMAK